MSVPKMKPCPKCGEGKYLAVFRYESGWRHVECCGPGCNYLGPGGGSIKAAVREHNFEREDRAANYRKAFQSVPAFKGEIA